MPLLSNPAMEIFSLCEEIHNKVRPNKSTSNVIADFIDVKVDSDEWFAALAIISARFKRLEGLVSSLAIPDGHKSRSVEAINHVRRFYQSDRLAGDFSKYAADVFNPQMMAVIFMLGPMTQAVAPVMVPTDDEREEHLARLESIAAALETVDDPFAPFVLLAIGTAIRMVRHLSFYGSDALVDELLRIYGLASQAAANARDHEAAGTFKKAGMAVAGLFTLLLATDAAFTSIENHYARGQRLISYISGMSPAEQKRLPPPRGPSETTALRPEEPEVTEGG